MFAFIATPDMDLADAADSRVAAELPFAWPARPAFDPLLRFADAAVSVSGREPTFLMSLAAALLIWGAAALGERLGNLVLVEDWLVAMRELGALETFAVGIFRAKILAEGTARRPGLGGEPFMRRPLLTM